MIEAELVGWHGKRGDGRRRVGWLCDWMNFGRYGSRGSLLGGGGGGGVVALVRDVEQKGRVWLQLGLVGMRERDELEA